MIRSLQVSEKQAQKTLQWQEATMQLHERLMATSVALSKASDGVRTATAFLESAQRRSHSALAMLLGQQFSSSDALFVLAAAGAFVALGWHDATQSARPMLLLTLGVTHALERALLSWLAPWQAVTSLDCKCRHRGHICSTW
jgi:hypothetical protein